MHYHQYVFAALTNCILKPRDSLVKTKILIKYEKTVRVRKKTTAADQC